MSNAVNHEVSIDALKPHPRNFRSHPEHQIQNLVASYRRFGQFRSIVAVEDTPGEYLIIAGHGITEAMRRAGASTVRIDELPKDTPDVELEAIMIADNLHSQEASDNDELLAMLLQEQQDAGFDLASMGADDETLRQMLQEMGDAIIDNAAPDVQFKEFDETIEDGMDTEMCASCGKLCVKGKA